MVAAYEIIGDNNPR